MIEPILAFAPERQSGAWVMGVLLVGTVGACGLAFGLAAQHPVWPALAVSAVFCWMVLTACFPASWLFAVPACLPWLNFSPWTGWRVVEEFDLLLLATLAGAYGRWAWELRPPVSTGLPPGPKPPIARPATQLQPVSAAGLSAGTSALPLYLLVALVLTTGVSAWRGLAGWPGPGNAGFAAWLFQDEHGPLSSLRIGKSLWFAALLLPLGFKQVQRDGTVAGVHRLFAYGMCVGLAVVAGMALWERAAFPGWLNFSTHYRTTATFWEMHFGGAAIDIYLAASAPFVVWFLLGQKRPLPWLVAASLVALALYAVLTTFSRGVYGAVLVPLLLLVAIKLVLRHRHWWQTLSQSWDQKQWRGRAGVALALLLGAELLTVVWGGTYMRERLADSEADLGQRLKHWHRGLALMQTPADQLWGIGLGRLPARYAAQGPAPNDDVGEPVATELSGRAQVLVEPHQGGQPGKAFLRLSGPATQAQLGGLFSVNQRLGRFQLQLPKPADSGLQPGRSQSSVRGQPPRRFGVVLQVRQGGAVRSKEPATVLIKLCEKHLIYEGNCHLQAVQVPPLQAQKLAQPGLTDWQILRVTLQPYQNLPVQGFLQRSIGLSLSVVDAGQTVDIASIQLWAPDGQLPLQNTDFSRGMAHWLPGAATYYLPWHIDNLYLELLIERGWLGLSLALALCVWAARCLWVSRQREAPLAPYLAASVLGCCLAGSVSSVLDAPRIGFLFFSLLFLAVLADYGGKKRQV